MGSVLLMVLYILPGYTAFFCHCMPGFSHFHTSAYYRAFCMVWFTQHIYCTTYFFFYGILHVHHTHYLHHHTIVLVLSSLHTHFAWIAFHGLLPTSCLFAFCLLSILFHHVLWVHTMVHGYIYTAFVCLPCVAYICTVWTHYTLHTYMLSILSLLCYSLQVLSPSLSSVLFACTGSAHHYTMLVYCTVSSYTVHTHSFCTCSVCTLHMVYYVFFSLDMYLDFILHTHFGSLPGFFGSAGSHILKHFPTCFALHCSFAYFHPSNTVYY